MRDGWSALGNVVTLRAGIGFPPALQGRTDGRIPFAKVGDISNSARAGDHFIHSSRHHVTEEDVERLRARVIPRGSTLFAKIGEAISQDFRVMAGVDLLIDNNAMAAVPSLRVDDRYLFRFLQTVGMYSMASTTSVPSLRKSDLEAIPIPLPSLPEQRRIAAILDQADELRAKRRRALALLDELADAIFVDVFGSQSWPMMSLAAVASVQGGLTVNKSRVGYGRKTEYLRVANVARGRINLDDLKTIGLTAAEETRVQLQQGDLLIVEGHGNFSEVGRVARWADGDRPMVHQNHLIRARPLQGRVDSVYLERHLNSSRSRSYFKSVAKTTSGLNTINITNVKEAPVPVPPMTCQRRFAEHVQQIERTKNSHRAHLARLDELFAALQHRAFNGEL